MIDCFRKWRFASEVIESQKGFGIINVLMGSAIGIVVVVAFLQMFSDQTKEAKFLRQKYEVLGLKDFMLKSFSNDRNCSCQLNRVDPENPNEENLDNLIFNSTIVDGSNKINLKKLFSGCLKSGVEPFLMAEEGKRLTGTQTNLIVDKIELTSLRPTGTGNEWQGMWKMSFLRNEHSSRSIPPLQLPLRFIANTTLNGATEEAAFVSQCSRAYEDQVHVSTMDFDTDTDGYFGCPDAEVEAPSLIYRAKRKSLLISGGSVITTGDNCSISLYVRVEGPGVNEKKMLANLGNNLNAGNMSSALSSTHLFTVEPGQDYNVTVSRLTKPIGSVTNAQAVKTTQLIIMDF